MKATENSLKNDTLKDYNDTVTKALSLLSNSYNILVQGSTPKIEPFPFQRVNKQILILHKKMINLEKILNLNVENANSKSLNTKYFERNMNNSSKNKTAKNECSSIIEMHNKMNILTGPSKIAINTKAIQKTKNKSKIDIAAVTKNVSRHLYTPIGNNYRNQKQEDSFFKKTSCISENKIHKSTKRENSLQLRNKTRKNSNYQTQIVSKKNKHVSFLLNIEDKNGNRNDDLNCQIFRTQNDEIFHNDNKIILPCQKSKIISKAEFLRTHQYFFYKPKSRFNSIFGTRNTYLNSHTPLHSRSHYCAVCVK